MSNEDSQLLLFSIVLILLGALLFWAASSARERVDAFVAECRDKGGKAFEGRHEWVCITADDGIVARADR